jgi:hypothetical protein
MGTLTRSSSRRWQRRLLLALLVPLPALAWNAAGHRLVACIAWDRLDQHSRAEVSQLLRGHPDYPRWRQRSDAAQGERAVFIEASIWADEIRKDRRFYSAGIDAPTATLPGFPDMERRRDWHYVNRPLPAVAPDRPQRRGEPRVEPRTGPSGESFSGRLDRALGELAQTLGSPDARPDERRYALPWLIHLVGDAHQPLHASVRLDASGGEQRPDSALEVINPFNPRQRSTTLHAFWDDLPGPPWLRGDRLDTLCRSLAAATPAPAPSRPEQWLSESWEIARDSAYPPAGESVPTIDGEFYQGARAIANRRIALAGYRLADQLRAVLAGR